MSLVNRIANLFRRAKVDNEIDAELKSHIEMRIEDNLAAGMSAKEARRDGLLRFGNPTVVKERVTGADTTMVPEIVWADINFAARQLRKHPGFTAIAVVTIAFGIAANVSVFSFINALFLQNLPAKDSSRLVRVIAPRREFSYPEFAYLRQHTKTLDSITSHYSTAPLYVTVNTQSFEVQGAVVSNEYFPMLGVTPRLGHFFGAKDDSVADRDAIAIVSYSFWKRIYGGDPSIIGKTLIINKRIFGIAGVAPENFHGVEIGETPNEIWIPTMMVHTGYRWCDGLKSDCAIFRLMARLKPGTSASAAQAEIATLLRQFQAANPSIDEKPPVLVTPASGVEGSLRHYFTMLVDLLVAVAGALLLVVCANIGGLLIARGTARRAEFAIRRALGASRSRIARQLLTENTLIAGGAGGLGVVLSVWAGRWFAAFYAVDSEGYRHLYDVRLDARVLLYSVAVTAITGLLFGLFPAVQASRADINEILKNNATRGATENRSRSFLIVAQVALCFTLLVAAGLLIKSIATLEAGGNLDVHHVLGLRLRPRLVQYSPQKAQAFLREVVSRLRTVPGVRSVTLTKTEGEIWRDGSTMRLAIPGREYAKPADEPLTNSHEIAPEYFATLRIPFIAGRDFTNADREGFPRVAIVNQTLAKQLFLNGSPLARSIVLDDHSYQIVGEVKDAQVRSSLDGPAPMAYVPFWQNDTEPQIDARIGIRLDGDPAASLEPIRHTIAAIDPNVPITEAMPLIEQVRASYADARLASVVAASAGVLTLLLSAMGLFGVIGYEVNRRTREIGIRIALGAQPRQVVGSFLRQGLTLVASGTAAGIVLALLSMRLLASWLFGVQASDTVTLLLAAVLLTTVATLAIYLPSRRAALVNPLEALRYE